MRQQLVELHPAALAVMVERAAGELAGADLEARRHGRSAGRPRRVEWHTGLGLLRPAVPQVADDGYFPQWLLRTSPEVERALIGLVAAACIRPLTQSRVHQVLRLLGIADVGKPKRAELSARLSSIGADFRARPLHGSSYSYLALGAAARTRRAERVYLAVAMAVTPDGLREIVGIEEEAGEDEALCAVLRSVIERGLVGVRMVVYPQRPGVHDLITEMLPDAAVQRSPADVARDVSSLAPAPAARMVAGLVDTVYDQPDRTAVETEHARLVEQLRVLFPDAGARLGAVRDEMLAFAAFPRGHWSLIWKSVPFEPVSSRHAAVAKDERPNLFVVTPPSVGTEQVIAARRGARPRPTPRALPADQIAAAAPAAADQQPEEAQPAFTASAYHRIASAVVAVAAIVAIAVTLPGPWLAVAALAIGLILLSLGSQARPRLITVLLAVTVAATAVDYLTWRTEVANWAGWMIALPLLAAEMFGALHTLGLQYTVLPARRQPLVQTGDPSRRRIFILIPTVNEGPAVLTPTIAAAVAARRRYLTVHQRASVTIAVCNDGRVARVDGWRDVQTLAHRLGVECVTRTTPGGNKAGNLEHARKQLGATGDALIAIFDADQIAHPDFLVKTVPPFGDPSVGWVQTGQYYRNLDQPVARWAHDQQALFYRVLCPGKEAHNAAFICGTNVVIRADALDEIGGLPQDSVTEDFAASIRLHPRWRSVFLTDALAQGLGPMDLPAFLRQQRRWAVGTIGILRSNWRDIFLPRSGGLSVEQRIQYALACTHYLSGIRDAIYVLAPVAFLLTGIPAVHRATLGDFLWHFLPYFAFSQAAFWYAGRGVTGLRGIVIGFGSFPVLIQATATVILGRRAGFGVTAKERRPGRSLDHLYVYLGAIALCAVAIAVALLNPHLRREAAAVSVLWVLYDIALLCGVLALGLADLGYGMRWGLAGRGAKQVALVLRPALAVAVSAGAAGSRASVLALRRANPRVIAMSLAVAVLVVALAYHVAAPSPVVLAVERPAGQPVLLGLSLAEEVLTTRPKALQAELCLPFTVIGRTQDVTDSFDARWANSLNRAGREPWITLQFANFLADGKPPLDASLLAIENGVHDADLARWAQAIHAYGRPVFITILLHVDRNWAVTSAVANGGIPQDVPRVWEHVRAIFRGAGDTNVAWVWAPADPAADHAYAPPESTIDAVLQSFIRYPGTAWPDTTRVLSAVSARHPGKPLFVEVTGEGPAAEKAAWLEGVALATATSPGIYALLYHEGSPNVPATAADDLAWSIESDATSLRAMSSWQALVPTSTLPCAASGAGA